jgi:D-3-phosphoglycerate dehydrogenase / 2-oxoglutarate reductase
MTLSILVAEPYAWSSDARAVLLGLGDVIDEAVPQERLAERVRDIDVLVVRLGLRVTRDVIEGARRLRAIVTPTTGLDHIDVEAAGDRGVAVVSLKGETDFLRTIPATAEYTWGLLLALVRRIPWAFDSVRRGEWDRDRFRGSELAGRRLGILGLGRIGQLVAGYGLAFGMEVGAHDRGPERDLQAVRLFPSLEDLLRWSEVLSVHLPLEKGTHGLLGREHLSQLPRGAILLNTARGAIVDEEALVELLEEGHLVGAAVDVLSAEAPAGEPGESQLVRYARTRDNLIVTPHIGGATTESMRRTEIFVAEKLRRLLAEGRAAS